jgi:uncharacterized protein (TIRG00374 family)
MGDSRSSRDILIFLAKCVVSAVLIGFLLSRMSLDEIRTAMKQPQWGWLAASLFVYGVSAAGGAVLWSLILRGTGITAPRREIFRLYFIGLFFNNFLPANIGGDAYKIVDLGRHERRPLAVFCATLLDRLLGLGALCGLALVFLGIAALLDIPLPGQALLLLPVALLIAAVVAALLSRRLGRRLPEVFARLRLPAVGEKIARISGEFGAYRRRILWLHGILLLSVCVQALRMLTHILVALGLGYALGGEQMMQLMVLVPLLAVSLTLPITINGIGLRETVSAKLLTWAGLAEPHAVAMEVAAYLVQVVFSLQGGVLLWMGRWGRAPERETDPTDGGNL